MCLGGHLLNWGVCLKSRLSFFKIFFLPPNPQIIFSSLQTHRSACAPCAFDPGRCAATQTFRVHRRWEVPPDPNRSSPGGSSRSPRCRFRPRHLRGRCSVTPFSNLTDREQVWARSQTAVPSVRQTEPRAFNFFACAPEGEMSHASVPAAPLPGDRSLLLSRSVSALTA